MTTEQATQARRLAFTIRASDHVKDRLHTLDLMIAEKRLGETLNYVTDRIPNLSVAIADQIDMIYEAAVKCAWLAKR